MNWRRGDILLYLMAMAMPLSYETWGALLNNFSIAKADFTGVEIGILQSLREVPGFLAFSAVFIIILVREQSFALVALGLLGLGTAMTGFFPTANGLYATTFLMSAGFHYYETMQQSLALQWTDKAKAPEVLGRIIAANSVARLVALAGTWAVFAIAPGAYRGTYLAAGLATIAVAVFASLAFPKFPQKVVQHKHMVLRSRYWLYYALVFMSGARRQIFLVFAGFLMVEKFHYDVEAMALLLLFNAAINMLSAPYIGRLISRFGEQKALIAEYVGLILIFAGYAYVEDSRVATGLYVADHVFFAAAIAIKTYFQKIADPADIASTSGVSFSINHIAAVIIPALFGMIWLWSSAAVFLAGAGMAVVSLLLAFNIPNHPEPGNEVRRGQRVIPA